MRKVSTRQYLRTIHDVTDGFGGRAGSCRVYTLPRDDRDSRPLGWIRGHTKIGPVRQVGVICCLDQCWIEVQVPSMSRNESHSWIGIHQRPESQRGWILARPRRPSSRRWDGEFLKRWQITRNNIKHWGDSCVEATGTIDSDELPFQRIHPDWQKEVEWHSCLWYCRKVSSCLENLEKISVLRRLEPQPLVCSCHPRPLRRTVAWSWIVESRCDSTMMERLLVSCRKLLHGELDPTSRSHRRWKVHRRRATDGLLQTFGPHRWWDRRWVRWFNKAKKSTLQEQVDNFSGRILLDHFGKNTR